MFVFKAFFSEKTLYGFLHLFQIFVQAFVRLFRGGKKFFAPVRAAPAQFFRKIEIRLIQRIEAEIQRDPFQRMRRAERRFAVARVQSAFQRAVSSDPSRRITSA